MNVHVHCQLYLVILQCLDRFYIGMHSQLDCQLNWDSEILD